MKAYKTRLGIIALLTPFLMANSPAPMPNINYDYEYIDVTCDFKSYTSDQYYYDLTIENLGESYIFLNGFHGRLIYNQTYVHFDYNDAIFENEMLPPHVKRTFDASSFYDYRDYDTKSYWKASYYSIKDDIEVKNIQFRKTNDKEYKLSYDKTNFGDYYYAAVVDVTYKGEHRAFHTGLYADNVPAPITTNEDLDLNQLTIESITFYISTYHTYHGGEILTYILYFFIGLLIVGALIIPPAIIIPVSIVKYRHRKNKGVTK